jgi:hypothetical protein
MKAPLFLGARVLSPMEPTRIQMRHGYRRRRERIPNCQGSLAQPNPVNSPFSLGARVPSPLAATSIHSMHGCCCRRRRGRIPNGKSQESCPLPGKDKGTKDLVVVGHLLEPQIRTCKGIQNLPV